jgi:hypothetical protein
MTGYKIAAILSSIAGLISCFFGFFNDTLGTSVPFGMMFFSFGVMFWAYSQTGAKKTKKTKAKI